MTPCPLTPPAYLHISIPFAPNLFPSVSPSFYTHVHSSATFLHPPSLPFLFHTALSPYPPFRFFGIFYGCSPATSTISHPYTLTSIVFPSSLTPAWPVPSPSPCLLPLHPFRFFDTFYGCSPATSSTPHHYILTTIILPSPLSMPDPSHPPAPACPLPYPPFSLFWAIYGRFFVYIYMLFHLYMYIHDLWH